MANIAKSGTPSLATVLPPNNCQPNTGLVAGEAIAAGDTCYVKSDGKIWKASGAAANALARYKGVAAAAASAGEAVTVLHSVAFHYGSGMTPGAAVYLSTDTAGGIADANATATSTIGYVIDATRVYFGPPLP